MIARRIALLGGESTGKTTLAIALSQALGEPWVAEYGRELTEARGGAAGLVFDDLLAIAEEQLARENSMLAQAHRWLICDTTPLTTLHYSLAMFGHADPALLTLAGRAYDLTLLCETDMAFADDGWRADPAFREAQQAWLTSELAVRGVPFHRISGDPAQRLAQALAAINSAPVGA